MGVPRRPGNGTARARLRRALRLGVGVPVAASGSLFVLGMALPHLATWGAPPGLEGTPPDPTATIRLIAHRGGVVGDGRPEGSLAALGEAITRGYAGVEIDVRETRDAFPVVHHDASLWGAYGDACDAHGLRTCHEGDLACAWQARLRGQRRCAIGDLTLSEVREVTASSAAPRVVPLETFVRRATRAGMEVMLDFKENLSSRAIDRIAASLTRHAQHRRVYLIGASRTKWELARRGWGHFGAPSPLMPLAATAVGVPPRELFLFQNALSLTPGQVAHATRMGIEVVPTLNWHHLDGHDLGSRDEAIAHAHGTLHRLVRLGVRTFQVDSDLVAPWLDGDSPSASAP
jgi:glycerophosphoryl diester phosphodiesterase